MDGIQMQILIEQLLDNSFFRMSMKQQLQNIVDMSLQKQSLPTPAIHMMVEEIMEHITFVIGFKIKEILDDQYSVLADHCGRINGELEGIKIRVGKVEERGKEIIRERQKENMESRRESEFEPQRSLLTLGTQKNLGSKIESNNNLKYSKLKQQVDMIKINLERHSFKQILAFIAQTNQQINNKIDTQYQKLYNQIQNSIKNTSILNGKSTDFTQNKYQCLQHKLDNLTLRFNNFEGLIEERYETNFRNVWNVITDLGTNLSSVKNKQKQKEYQETNAKESVDKKGISSFFGWK